ncbi:Methicillin resistance protein [Syntrophobotulus glycolicus DSM 8271]|uniref:Methicillin resistance protein n=1 Tax=Syntrophobotulus glycolicus (strain DSM 8271 / FlGlyR) TaxID=645991 RepID=F0T2D3_SYNGF|nr:peptidoglycan bridge formation glycyltransferase FemA/FemB family protein [Syntrophobotulus glycolicus]ADY57561.1 Methicillin resistance protein [Syntrophobotulus glycolicus DSM 8271]
MKYSARWLEENEKQIFNHFINVHPKGHSMQLWEWGAIKGRTGWQPWRMILEEDGKIIAAATVLERKLPLIGIPIFYCPRGPVVDFHDQEKVDAVLASIQDLAKKRKAILLKIDPDIAAADKELEKYFLTHNFHRLDAGKNFEGVQPRFVFRLDISPDEECLLANMQQKTRYNIRLAEKKGVVIRTGTRQELPKFYEVLKETTERDHFLVRAYSYFEDLYDTLVPAGFGQLFVAEYEGEIISGTFAFLTGQKAWYIYGASSNAHRKVMPNYLIQWEMIRWAKKMGCTLYDFRGVSGDLSEDNPLYGLYRFKKGFNGEFTEFIGEWDYIYRPFFYRFWQTAEKLYSGKLKGLLARFRRGK